MLDSEEPKEVKSPMQASERAERKILSSLYVQGEGVVQEVARQYPLLPSKRGEIKVVCNKSVPCPQSGVWEAEVLLLHGKGEAWRKGEVRLKVVEVKRSAI